MASQMRPYRGYPYLEPVGTDVPSIDATKAEQWRHLPVRQLRPDTTANRPSPSRPSPSYRDDDDDGCVVPVVYIDLPEDGSAVSLSNSDRRPQTPSRPYHQEKSQPDDEEPPTVYIDVPEASGSDVSQSRTTSPQEEPTFVQDTIFYNPFENKRIDMSRESSQVSESDDESEIEPVSRPRPMQRPNYLNFDSAGCSGSSYPTPPRLPAMLAKETEVYQPDGFPMSPIPMSEFPEPPPSYTEVASTSSPAVVQEEPPRTVVILPGDNQQTSPASPQPAPSMDTLNQQRKFLNCPQCGIGVHTLVIRETGIITHLVAFICLLICMLPCVLAIYCTDCFKIKNHYCPNCNNIIGHESPFNQNKVYYNR